MGKVFAPIGTVLGWLVLIAAIVAVMTIWDWDPVGFITSAINRISELFLSWDWFRSLVSG